MLLKGVTIVCPGHKDHNKKRDILIKNGVIEQIAASIDVDDSVKTFQRKGACVSIGWMDPSVSLGEPGYEERETIEKGLDVAARSGFTHIIYNADTKPVIDNKATVELVKALGTSKATTLVPSASLTVGATGKALTEMFEMTQSGAATFYDYKKSFTDANQLKLALLYAKPFNGLVQSFPLDENVAAGGLVTETKHAVQYGLKTQPALAESIRVSRDLFLLEYTGGKLHIPSVTTEASIKLIKAAKKKGLNVTCSTTLSHLSLTDEVICDFDTRYKLSPPLRNKSDVKALKKAVENGTIDCITADHRPLNIEEKKVEFDHAMTGSIGLEAIFPVLNNILNTDDLIILLTNSYNVFLQGDKLEENTTANLTIFENESTSTHTESHIRSSCTNDAHIGLKTKGSVLGIINGKKSVWNEK